MNRLKSGLKSFSKVFHPLLRFTTTTLRFLLLATSVALVCILSYTLAANSYTITEKLAFADLATLLFGAASLSFFMFSVLIAGWAAFFSMRTVQVVVHEAVESQMNKKVKLLEAELRGRVLSVLGHLNGETSIDPSTLAAKDRERLAEAVRLCQQGYDFLQEVKGPVEYMGLNNLVYYTSILGDHTKKTKMLENARILDKAGRDHNALNLRLTACRAILEFSSDAGEKNDALEELRSIANAPEDLDIPKKARNEARLHLASFAARASQEGTKPTLPMPTPTDLSTNHPSGEPPCSKR